MDTKSKLIKKHDDEGLSKKELGQLRRILLTELLDKILADGNEDKYIGEWLDKKKTKIDKAKVAKAVGYDTKPDSIRQSFSELVKGYESKLLKAGILSGDSKTNAQIRKENLTAFTEFLNIRLNEPDYHWPRNVKGYLYRKGIWGYFLDIPPKEVTSMPSFFHNDESLERLLSGIDVKIAKELVKSINYESQSVIDEMSDTMTSHALSSLRQKLKAKTQEVVMLREELKTVQLELLQYRYKEKSRLKSGKNAFKAGIIH
ncbi:hypothetical protein [Paraglaciecola polaris]|uniref:Uncharacterized protein n=1 Tax=Paraglaciecola polaris LMG 21857 TaxID=1129793 RepID=K7AAB0_9ALTE|nr:hypothetical protein [Paraglaciecola polaris]GAC32305.1 hypothetical protein GPLA_1391 [Paraglaciecola polaris LMG 21857]